MKLLKCQLSCTAGTLEDSIYLCSAFQNNKFRVLLLTLEQEIYFLVHFGSHRNLVILLHLCSSSKG